MIVWTDSATTAARSSSRLRCHLYHRRPWYALAAIALVQATVVAAAAWSTSNGAMTTNDEPVSFMSNELISAKSAATSSLGAAATTSLMAHGSSGDDDKKNQNEARELLFFRARSFKIARLELYDSLTDLRVRTLSNGMVINVSDIAGMLKPNFNIRAFVSGDDDSRIVHSIVFGHNGNNRYHTERSEPYFFCGHYGSWETARTCKELNTYGTHTVTATPHLWRRGRVRLGASTTVTFTIARGTVRAPTTAVAPVPAPMVAPLASPIKSPVTSGGSPVGVPVSAPKGPVAVPLAAPLPAPQTPPSNGGIPPTTAQPSSRPSAAPNRTPTARPSYIPSAKPSSIPSVAPIVCPSVEAYVNAVTLSNRSLTLNGTTAEDKALSWLAVNDTLKLKPCLTDEASRFRIRQRFALLSFWFQQAANNAVWPVASTTDWTTVDDECQWSGIVCTSINVGGAAGVQMAVTGVSSSSKGGSLPMDFGLLTNLQRIVTSGLGGSFPSTVVNWRKIKHVEFSSAAFVGSMPELLGQWSGIEYFELSNSDGGGLVGTIPDSIGSWKNVTTFFLDGHELTSPLPLSLGQLTTLGIFGLAHNMLNGTIPDWIQNFTSLSALSLDKNSFSGSLPSWIGQLTNLTTLNLATNKLVGELPESLGNLTAIKIASFQDNNFNGTMPAPVCSAPNRLLIAVDCVKVGCGCCGC